MSSDQHSTPHPRYAREITPDGSDSLSRIARRIAPGSTVLDVGTGPGELGRHLSSRGCTVDGLEVDPELAEQARVHYRRLVQADVESADLSAALPGGGGYDVVVCADVLEHLRDPDRALAALIGVLRPGGRVLVSVPNVGYAGLVAALLDGEFHYRPEGLLDRTHLRFFTRATLLDLLRRHGLGALALEAVAVPVQHSEFREHDPDQLPPALRDALLSRPDALAYQFIVEAGRGAADEAGDGSRAASPAALRLRLYWRGGDEAFDESRSIPAAEVAEQTFRFVLPELAEPPARLRLDVDDRPGFLGLRRVAILGADRAEAWSWSADGVAVETLDAKQLVAYPLPRGRWWVSTGEDPALELPVPTAALRAASRGAVEVVLERPSPLELCLAQRAVAREVESLDAKAAALDAKAVVLGASLAAAEARVKEQTQTLYDLRRALSELSKPSGLRRSAREVRRAVRPYRCSLAPDGIVPGDAGGNARIRLRPIQGRLAAGWVELDFEIGDAEGDRLRPALLADDGSGLVQESPTPMPEPFDGRAHGIMKLPDRVTDLFLDPRVDVARCRLGRLRMRELSRPEAAVRLAGPLVGPQLRHPTALLASARDVYRTYRKEGWAVVKRRFREDALSPRGPRDYQAWVREHDTLTAADRDRIARRAVDLAGKLPVTVVLLADQGDDAAALEASLASVEAQLYPQWNGLVAGPEAIARSSTHARLLGQRDRWSWPPVHRESDLSARVGEGLAVFVRAGDVLALHALFVLADAFARHPLAEIVYGDEDALVGGARAAPWFKPDWSPYRLWHQDYVRHRFACRAGALRHLGAAPVRGETPFRVLLEACARAADVRHVPFVLHHVERQAPRGIREARRALEEHLAGAIPGASVDEGRLPDTFRVRLPLPAEPPLVSIVIPTRNRAELLRNCITTLRRSTKYPRYEILVVDNDSDEPEARSYLAALEARGEARVVKFPGPFNFSAINNAAVRQARGDVVVLLNNDIEVHDPGWLGELVSWALREDVGAVGCRLRYADGRLQHAGVVLGMGGLAGHLHREMAADEGGWGGAAWVPREVGAVTAACVAMRREVYDAVEGMDDRLPVAFNDVDLCLRIRGRGRTIVFTPYADLLHLESASRGDDLSPEKAARLAAEAEHVRVEHGYAALRDPFYSPNLSLDTTSAELAFPPRVVSPWRLAASDRPRVAFLAYRLMKGFGVDVVVAEQVEFFCARGYDVTVLVLEKDDFYDARLAGYLAAGALRILLVRSPDDALAKMATLGPDVVIAHTPPFHQVLPRISAFRVLLDHGEPPADLFPDAADRRRTSRLKVAASRHVELPVAISEFVRADSGLASPALCPNGNDHMLRRRSNLRALAGTFRRRHGLGDAFVVLNVTRYLADERRYKGVEEYAAVRDALVRARPDLRQRVVFVLAGRSEAADRAWAAERGLLALSNLDEDELLAAYLGADAYLSTSQWEGYNLGIAQALALGVPTFASARGAHPEFPISTSNDPAELAGWVAALATEGGRDGASTAAGALRRLRRAVVFPWKASAARLEHLIRERLALRGDVSVKLPAPLRLAGAEGEPPALSILILNKDKPELLAACIRSIEEHCDVPHEILVGDTGSTDPATLQFYEASPHQVHYLGFYQFSVANNVLAARARGQHLLFLNNDTELIRTRFAEALEYLRRNPDVGCLGAYLVYADRRIQHAGVRICPEAPYRGIPEHFDKLKPIEGYPGLAAPRDVVAVTGAMLLVSAEVFRAAEGFDEIYEEEAQDIDLCLRLRARGLRSVMHPALLAFHHENATRTVKEAPADRAEFLRRFGKVIEEELWAWQASVGLGR